MNLEEAQDAFDKFLEGVDEYHVADFLSYIQRRWFVRDCSGVGPAIAYTRIRDIATEIRSLVPLNGILSSERIAQPLQGENSDCDPKHTEHMDAFLYDDYELDELEREKKINRYYCQDCGSHKVQPLTFISHSASKNRVEFIFSSLLPNLTEKIVLDVGSRLGALLYGAYFYSNAKKIIGVEMNKDLCEIQKKIIEKHNLKDRIEVICDDICNQPDVVKNSDVIILNNVFEFFLAPDQQSLAWKFLRNNITRPKTLLVTVPSLEKSLKHLKNFEAVYIMQGQLTRILGLLHSILALVMSLRDCNSNEATLLQEDKFIERRDATCKRRRTESDNTSPATPILHSNPVTTTSSVPQTTNIMPGTQQNPQVPPPSPNKHPRRRSKWSRNEI